MTEGRDRSGFFFQVTLLAVLCLLSAGLLLALMQLQNVTNAIVSAHHYWSEGQRKTTYALESYLLTGETSHLDDAAKALAGPVSVNRAREVASRDARQREEITRLMVEGGSDPRDVSGMLWVYRHMGGLPHMRDALADWAFVNPVIGDLQSSIDELQRRVQAGLPLSAEVRDAQLARVRENRAVLEAYAPNFTRHTIEGRRQLQKWVLVVCLGMIIVFVLLSARIMMRLASRLDSSERWSNAAFKQASVGMLRVRESGRILEANQAVARILSSTPAELVGRNVGDFFRNGEWGEFYDRARQGGATREAEVIDAAGRPLVARCTLSELVIDARARPDARACLMLVEDVSDAHAMREELDRRARLDFLTGLLNRGELERELARMLDRHAAGQLEALTVAMIDLDRFRYINESMGLAMADRLLQLVAERLKQGLPRGARIGRLGGDQFMLLLPDMEAPQGVELSARLSESLSGVGVDLGHPGILLTASIGVLGVSQQRQGVSEVVRAADAVCETAKQSGRNRVRMAMQDGESPRHPVSHGQLAALVHDAIESDRLFLHAQRIVPCSADAQSAGGCHYEVLLRIMDAEGKLHLPGTLLAAAELYGLSATLDRWVLARALRHVAEIKEADPGASPMCFVNLAPSSIADPAFLEAADAMLKANPENACHLCLEITEHGAMSSLNQAIAFIEMARGHGCRIALDDFGVGHSSFAYLRMLPCDVVKIDGSFARDLGRDPANAVLIRSICEMSHLLGKQVVVEWVEPSQAAGELPALGADFMQGYALHRPVPLEQFGC